MRKTLLRQTSVGTVVLFVFLAILFAVLRVFVLAPDGVSAKGQAASQGKMLFTEKGCVSCHFTDSTETKVGPGLKNLFERDSLTVSGRKVTEENIREQLESPYRNMPSFADRLDQEEADALIDYLKSL